ncbi:hypothetical protein AB0J80_35615 [Actinoplanes sp. NPDC049548]|uniref:hypothetical protein n=1 Tax=Actinoplanes sp. NPDC049548 TaxID=3155152 RepID=UPI0034317803
MPEDPHIHVEVNVVRADAAVRNVVASAFGLAADLPAEVRTGCGLRVPYAMTSARPESVTCLACREHAHREHLRFAEQVAFVDVVPGMSVGGSLSAAAEHRRLARRFAGG